MGKITKTSAKTPFVFLSIFGQSGLGKSPIAATWARLLSTMWGGQGRVLYADMENSLLSVPEAITEGFDVWTPEVTEKGLIQRAYQQVSQEVVAPVMAGKYDAMVLDTATVLGAGLLDDVRKIDYFPERQNAQGGKEKRETRLTIDLGDGVRWGIPGMSDFRAAGDQLAEIIGGLRRAPCHVIVTAQEKVATHKDPAGIKEIKGGMSLVGSESTFNLPAWFDACYYLTLLDANVNGLLVKRRALCTKQPPSLLNTYIIKDRIGGMDAIEWDPDAEALFRKIKPNLEKLRKEIK